MQPFPSNFLRDLLGLPHERVAYEALLRIAALRPSRFILEADHYAFDLDEAIERGLGGIRPVSGAVRQVCRRYDETEDTATSILENGISELSFEGCTVEVVTLTYVEGDSSVRRNYVIAPDQAVAEHFFLEVCRVAQNITGEMLVFENGGWKRNTRLHDALDDARLDDLVLRGKLLQQVVDDVRTFFESRAIYEKYRVPYKRGILLYGPPGNGKTHFLKGLLGTLSVPCLYVKSLDGRQGEHESLRRIFVRARAVAPCLLVLEDLDTIVSDANRSYFLNELDGFADNAGVVVLATTNYPERIDPAVIDRPSRFDRKYLFDLPSVEERRIYVERWSTTLEPEMRPSDLALARVAQRTGSFSFAYLKELTVSATISWFQAGRARSMDAVLAEVVDTLKEQAQRGRAPSAGTGSRRVGLIPDA